MQLVLRFHEAHAAPATTGDSLNEYREVEVLGVFHQLIDVRRWLRVLQRRQPGLLCGVHRGSLIAGQVKGARGRANELDAIVFTGPSEIRALRQKAITRINSICTGLLCCANDLIDAQISLNRLTFSADAHSFIRKSAVKRIAIFAGIDRDGLCPSFKGSTECTHGDFATVSYQNLFERWKRGISHFCVPFSSEDAAVQRLLLGDPHLSLEGYPSNVCPFLRQIRHTDQHRSDTRGISATRPVTTDLRPL